MCICIIVSCNSWIELSGVYLCSCSTHFKVFVQKNQQSSCWIAMVGTHLANRLVGRSKGVTVSLKYVWFLTCISLLFDTSMILVTLFPPNSYFFVVTSKMWTFCLKWKRLFSLKRWKVTNAQNRRYQLPNKVPNVEPTVSSSKIKCLNKLQTQAKTLGWKTNFTPI